ncbi:sialate O-acetylesterase [Mesorhizobium sp. UC74_2]|uniref:sialate O-acetylesterase n=1 Tax=Mesorhizobium sp. UC74_2 TaxID=3350171 RepID=UPI003672ACC8
MSFTPTKPAVVVFAPTTAGGAPRGASMAEAQTWGTEMETYAESIEARLVTQLGTDTIVVGVFGQSNVERILAYSWTPPPNLFLWNSDSANPGTILAPVPGSIMGVGYSFGAEIARRNPTKRVVVINVGRGSTPIANWVVTSGATPNMYAASKAAVEACLAYLGKTSIDYVLWWQGESDYLAGAATIANYVKSWSAMWFQFFGEVWFPRETPFAIMAVSERYVPDPLMKSFNRELRRVADLEPPYRTFVDTKYLAADLWDDPTSRIHMTAEGYDVAGRTAALAALAGFSQGRDATPWQTVVKRITESRTNTAIPIADKELKLSLRSGYTYNIRGKIWGSTSAAADFKWALDGPAATLIGGTRNYMTRDASGTRNDLIYSAGYPSGQVVPITGGDGFFMVEFDLIVTPTSSDAPFSFSWSQTAATGDNTYVFAGSFVELTEVS